MLVFCKSDSVKLKKKCFFMYNRQKIKKNWCWSLIVICPPYEFRTHGHSQREKQRNEK